VLTTRHRIRKSLQILTIFLLTNALFLAAYLFGRYAWQLNINPHPWNYFLFSSGFLFGPSLYWYSMTMARKVQPDVKTIFSHLVTFFIYLGFIFTYAAINKSWGNRIPDQMFQYVRLFMHLQILCYMIVAVREISLFQQKLVNSFSSLEKMNLSWLKLNVIAFICMWLADISEFVIGKYGVVSATPYEFLSFISIAVNFVFANLIIYKGLTTPELFIEITEHPARNKYSGSSLTPEQSRQLAEKLKEYMEKEKPYLEPELTLHELSARIAVHTKLVSQVINEQFKKNFYEFVNNYRVEEAKSMLLACNWGEKTILEVLYDCGFNSKSVFNTIFKKSTGLTPSQFRKQYSKAV
jgi:AraC-like DNA-binding protein